MGALELEEKKGARVWVDSDDERIHVDISSNPKLRKLRKVKKDGVIDGIEYSKRLFEFHKQKVSKNKGNKWVYEARKARLGLDEQNESSLHDQIDNDDSGHLNELNGPNQSEVSNNLSKSNEGSSSIISTQTNSPITEFKTGKIYRYFDDPVSYTHLTLPTTYAV